MRKVVAALFLSLDGVAEAPNQFMTKWDEVLDARIASGAASQDAVLLGRSTYDEWAPFWPESKIQPFADFINTVAKYVVTSSLPSHEWANTTVVDTDVEAFVRKLKTQPGRDIGVHGSISLVRSLLGAGLLDDLLLGIAPTVVGTGARLFDGLAGIDLDLVECTGTPSGYVLATYSRTNG